MDFVVKILEVLNQTAVPLSKSEVCEDESFVFARFNTTSWNFFATGFCLSRLAQGEDERGM